MKMPRFFVLCLLSTSIYGCSSSPGNNAAVAGAPNTGGTSTAGGTDGGSSAGTAGTSTATPAGGQAGAGTEGLAGAAGAAGAATSVVTANVTVSGASPLPVSPLFFGENYWSWVPAWGDPVAGVEAQTKSLNLKLLRAGGANNDQQNPIPFSNSEIDGFVAFAKSVGAEPLLQVPMIKNAAGLAATAQDAADLVTYVNKTNGYGVKYFSIGNEPDLYVDQKLMPAGYDALAFCTTFSAFAAAMRAVDPTIKIVGPDLSWKYQGANDWLTPFLENCGSITDIVAVHRYPKEPTACTESGAYEDAGYYRLIISRIRGILAATGQAAKPLAITEANITWDGDPAKSTMAASPGTFPAALWVADNLGVSLEEQLHSVSYWSLSEGWTLGFFSGSTPRPAYHVLKMFSTGFGSEVLQVSGEPTGVSIYAGHDVATGKTTLFVVNKTANTLALSVAFSAAARTVPVTLNVLPTSLQQAALQDDGSAVAITDYSATMSAPTAR